MMTARLVKNVLLITVNRVWRKLTGRFLFQFDGHTILQKTFPQGGNFNFVQVGAHDGVSHDFLFDFVKDRRPAGLVIEPVKEYFNQLVKNYKDQPSVLPLNIAVHATAKNLQLFKVKKESLGHLPEWASGTTSVDPNHHLQSGIEAQHLECIMTSADTLMNIIQPYRFLSNIDYLQIDVEGYDDEVVKQIRFSAFRPKMIRFEYMNLPESRTVATIKLLKQQGYFCYYEAMDVVAFLPGEVVL